MLARPILAILACSALVAVCPAAPVAPTSRPSAFENGLPADPAFFPIAVWLQDPRFAQRYKQVGINVYVGLWNGPTEDQLAALSKAGMLVICEQNAVGLKHKADKTIVGWMHGDEPDNAQALGNGKGYGPPIKPEVIIDEYKQMRQKDPTRPVMVNLGQGVAWDGWFGRGVRTKHPEDYEQYVKGCDIASFDIYPATHDRAEVAGNLWYVGLGVERLTKWAAPRPVWNCIEAARINADKPPTAQQVKTEVWMSLIHGSQGLIYFVHEWKPKFNERALLDNPELLSAVMRFNAQIRDLAPVLNSPTVENAARIETAKETPLAIMVKQTAGTRYLFAVAMRGEKTAGRFILPGLGSATAEVLDENRQIKLVNGAFEDTFAPWEVHLYRIK